MLCDDKGMLHLFERIAVQEVRSRRNDKWGGEWKKRVERAAKHEMQTQYIAQKRNRMQLCTENDTRRSLPGGNEGMKKHARLLRKRKKKGGKLTLGELFRGSPTPGNVTYG